MLPYALSVTYRSRSKFRPRAFCSLSLRVILLGTGLTFAIRSAEAELIATRIFNGQFHTVQEWLDAADRMGEAFGIDRHIRVIRGSIRRNVAAALENKGTSHEQDAR